MKKLSFAILSVGLMSGGAAQGAAAYPATVLSDTPLGYYRMSETSGTTANDATTPAENGVYLGGVTLGVTGPQDPTNPGFESTNVGAQFDDVDDHLEVTTLTTLNDTAYTYELWFKENGQSGGLGYFGGRGSGASLSYDAIGLSDGQLLFFNGSTVTFPGGGVSPTPNTWHYLAYTRSGSTVSVYLDGALVGSPFTSAISYGTSDRIVAGTRAGDTADVFYLGSLDELAIYDTALTAAQILNHYTVPEPSAAFLLGIGGLLVWRRRWE